MRIKEKKLKKEAISSTQIKAGYVTYFINVMYSDKLKLHYIELIQTRFVKSTHKYEKSILRTYPSHLQTIINVLSEIQANIDDLDNFKDKKIIEDPRYISDSSTIVQESDNNDDSDFL